MVSFATHRVRLREQMHVALDPVIGGYESCALLDFLSVFNPGDALLELGAKAYLMEAGIGVAYEADWLTFDAHTLRRALPPGGLIVFHGGGNINALNWKGLNIEFRLEVLRAFRDYRIVQLPQSVFIDDPALLLRVRDAFVSHPDAHFFARDRRSQEFCEHSMSLGTTLCPDMAFALGGFDSSVAACGRTAVFRHDNEVKLSLDRDPLFARYRRVYWLRKWAPTSVVFYALHVLALAARAVRVRPAFLFVAAVVRAYAQWLAAHQRRFIARALDGSDVVVTDRLHACISCMLMDVPFVALDNSYGKIHTFLKTWTPDLLERHAAGSASEAATKADALIGES